MPLRKTQRWSVRSIRGGIGKSAWFWANRRFQSSSEIDSLDDQFQTRRFHYQIEAPPSTLQNNDWLIIRRWRERRGAEWRREEVWQSDWGHFDRVCLINVIGCPLSQSSSTQVDERAVLSFHLQEVPRWHPKPLWAIEGADRRHTSQVQSKTWSQTCDGLQSYTHRHSREKATEEEVHKHVDHAKQRTVSGERTECCNCRVSGIEVNHDSHLGDGQGSVKRYHPQVFNN